MFSFNGLICLQGLGNSEGVFGHYAELVLGSLVEVPDGHLGLLGEIGDLLPVGVALLAFLDDVVIDLIASVILWRLLRERD